MKKMIRFGLCLGLLSAALTCTALAATDGYTTDMNGGKVDYQDGKYSASYTGTIEGNQYVLLVVKGTPESYSVSADTIVYIDQKQATGTSVSFENWIPMSTPDCVVLLGGVFGEGVDSPVVLGTLESQGVTVSGSVNVSNAAKATTIELYKQGTTTNPVYTVTIPAASSGGSANREFSLDGVVEGTYDLKITQEGHTSYWITEVPVGSDPLTLPNTVTLPCGDVNADGAINIDDLGVIISSSNYNKDSATAANKLTDLNGDGNINIDDLGVVLSSKNYNKGEISVPYN